MFLVVDNYDSFVYNLVRDLKELGKDVLVARNDRISLEEIASLEPEGIVISPGPKRPEDAGISMSIIDMFSGQIPILGVCLGHQAIARAFGAEIVKGARPMHGKLSMIDHDGEGVFAGLDSGLTVTRYHSLVVDEATLPECLEVTARSEDGAVMGIRHRLMSVEGIQFHSEAALTENGLDMMRNFTLLCSRYKNNIKESVIA